MSPPLRATAGQASGFVLVGVIMLILALTILGLSLFSLSSYESQFLGRALADVQVYNVATGALERAQLAMVSTNMLDSVHDSLPPNVDSTIAVQSGNSTGVVVWDSTQAVRIRVRASYDGSRRVMEAFYIPHMGEDHYKRLITAADTVECPKTGGGTLDNRWGQDYLSGLVLRGQADVSGWTTSIAGRPTVMQGTSMAPPLDDYWTEHWDLATTAPPPSAVYTLGTDGMVTYYKSAAASSSEEFSHRTLGTATFNIHGTVVWMFDRGFRAENLATIKKGSPDACLILVGKPSKHIYAGELYPIGVWFFGGVISECPLFLVSNTEVRIEHSNNLNGDTNVPDLSIYAETAWILGPIPGPGKLVLSHTPSMNDLIDQLNNQRVLPGGTQNSFSMVSGSWREFQ